MNGRAGRGQLRERLNWDKVLGMLDDTLRVSMKILPLGVKINGQGNQAGKISAERNRNVDLYCQFRYTSSPGSCGSSQFNLNIEHGDHPGGTEIKLFGQLGWLVFGSKSVSFLARTVIEHMEQNDR